MENGDLLALCQSSFCGDCPPDVKRAHSVRVDVKSGPMRPEVTRAMYRGFATKLNEYLDALAAHFAEKLGIKSPGGRYVGVFHRENETIALVAHREGCAAWDEMVTGRTSYAVDAVYRKSFLDYAVGERGVHSEGEKVVFPRDFELADFIDPKHARGLPQGLADLLFAQVILRSNERHLRALGEETPDWVRMEARRDVERAQVEVDRLRQRL